MWKIGLCRQVYLLKKHTSLKTNRSRQQLMGHRTIKLTKISPLWVQIFAFWLTKDTIPPNKTNSKNNFDIFCNGLIGPVSLKNNIPITSFFFFDVKIDKYAAFPSAQNTTAGPEPSFPWQDKLIKCWLKHDNIIFELWSFIIVYMLWTSWKKWCSTTVN